MRAHIDASPYWLTEVRLPAYPPKVSGRTWRMAWQPGRRRKRALPGLAYGEQVGLAYAEPGTAVGRRPSLLGGGRPGETVGGSAETVRAEGRLV